mgnify:CR=1 FL=1|tara:strand:- start:2119 stop:2406 length:288 start_codon:yes stop_codon:yes gene_type:complete
MSERPTIRDVVLRKQISKDVTKRSKTLDKLMQAIMEERKKRKAKGGVAAMQLSRTKKEKELIKKALRTGRAPSQSGVKTIGAFHKEPKNRLGKHG